MTAGPQQQQFKIAMIWTAPVTAIPTASQEKQEITRAPTAAQAALLL